MESLEADETLLTYGWNRRVYSEDDPLYLYECAPPLVGTIWVSIATDDNVNPDPKVYCKDSVVLKRKWISTREAQYG